MTGDDTLYGEKGEDTIFDTNGPKYGQPADTDFAYGGPEKDFINVWDGDDQDALCSGGGNDTVFADPQDIVDDPVVCN